MSILKKLRKPHFVILWITTFVATSCSLEETNLNRQNKSFDYSTFLRFKETSLNVQFPDSISEIKSINDRSIAIINKINSDFRTEIIISQKVLDLGGYSFYEMQTKGINTGIFSSVDIELLNSLNTDIQISGFDTAILNLEKNVLDLDLPQHEFQKYNSYANILKLIHNSNPQSLTSYQQFQRGGCLGAILAHAFATISLSSCSTGVLCPVAVAAWIVSYYNMIDACKKE